MQSHTKKEKGHTQAQAWTIKGIEIETRIAVQKASKKEGMTLGRYCNTKLREAASNTLKMNTIPINSEDMRSEIKLQIDSLKEDLHMIIRETLKEEKVKKKGLLRRIFK